MLYFFPRLSAVTIVAGDVGYGVASTGFLEVGLSPSGVFGRMIASG